MMPCMSFGVQCLHCTTIQLEPCLVIGDDNAGLINRHNVPIHLERLFFTVHADRSGNESLRVDHMWRTTRVHDTARIRQVLHQQPGATCMVEVNMRQEDKINIANAEALLFEGIQKKRHRRIGARIDERTVTTFDDQVAGILDWAQILGVDGDDAIVK